MNTPDKIRCRQTVTARSLVALVAVVACLLAVGQPVAVAAEWHGIMPLKSRRADVERELGKPMQAEGAGETGALNFKVAGGIVTVTFVNSKFVQTKKLSPSMEGTVLLIVLQHESASDTPETLELAKKNNFTREEKGVMTVYTNQKDGITYTFFNGRLKTTRFAPAVEQLARSGGLKSVL
jgi:hypothetical protein